MVGYACNLEIEIKRKRLEVYDYFWVYKKFEISLGYKERLCYKYKEKVERIKRGRREGGSGEEKGRME